MILILHRATHAQDDLAVTLTTSDRQRKCRARRMKELRCTGGTTMRIVRHLALIAAVGMVALLGGGAASRGADRPGARDLKIVFIDVEGGAATLIVTPLKESVLIDT